MRTINFTDISLDLWALDKFQQLTDQQLVLDNNAYNVWNTFWHDFRYDTNYLCLYDLVELTYNHAYNYFCEEYCCEDEEDYNRQSIYLHALELVRIWLKDNEYRSELCTSN